MFHRLINNKFIPLRFRYLRNGHIIIIFIIILIIILQVIFIPVKVDMSDLYLTAIYNVENKGIKIDKLNEVDFNARKNNFWESLIYYHKHLKQLKKYFGMTQFHMPYPKFPLISVLIARLNGGVHLLPPSNLIDIVSFLRRRLGSGITIRTKSVLRNSKEITNLNRDQIIFLLNKCKKYLSKRFEIRLMGFNSKNEAVIKSYNLSYRIFPNFFPILQNLFNQKFKLTNIALYEKSFLNVLLFNSKKRKIKKNKLLAIRKMEKATLDEVFYILKDFKAKMARVYTLKIYGKYFGKKFSKNFLIRFGNYPNFYKALNEFNERYVNFNKISLFESKVLKYKPNSREWIDSNQIPDFIKKAFILVEDDYFYVQAGGIDPIGLLKASFNYFFHSDQKGNASIIEQIYEMYLGKQNKGPIDKIIQILGAVYLSAYEKDRDRFVNLYIQSIPGSFWRDHNYGIKGIIKNYLNKNTIEDLTLVECAWLSRIALLPNTFGLDYIHFNILRKKLSLYKINIFDEFSLKQFLSDNSNLKIILKSFHKKIKNKAQLIKSINSLKRSYFFTNKNIKNVLNQFMNGNEFIRPIISKKNYHLGLNSEIDFNPSRFLNEYQSYTDQTRRDLFRFVGQWAMNSGLDVEVAFNESSQRILDEELSKSTSSVYSYVREENKLNELERKKYGGASILVKTHHIKTNKIVNQIIAISSKHSGESYFNWAVDGQRQFGSIFKWVALLLYLDKNGTLLDSFYDIPRIFEYHKKSKNGIMNTFTYRPDNWKRRNDPYGFYTFNLQDNIYNFMQSKNNTFVKISEIIGLDRLAQFLNETAEIKYINDPIERFRYSFKPILPLVLGAQETTSIRMAQINSVIANKGKFQPLTTIIRLIEMDGSSLYLDLSVDSKQIVSREAAEAALFCGYLNSYFGTAKRFIEGGIGKTGSSNMDVAFLAMTGRTIEEYIKEKTSKLLNYNLLYLVNMGLDHGKIHQGLYGGTVAAINAKNVFKRILKNKNLKNKKNYHSISGNLTNYFSNKFQYFSYPTYPKIINRQVLVPVHVDRLIMKESVISEDKLLDIQKDYIEYRDSLEIEEIAEKIAKLNNLNYNELNNEEKEIFRNEAFMNIQNRDFMLEDENYLKQNVYEINQDKKKLDYNKKENQLLKNSEINVKLEDLSTKKTLNSDNGFVLKKKNYIEVFINSNSNNDSNKRNVKIKKDLSDQEILDRILKSEKEHIEYSYGNLSKNKSISIINNSIETSISAGEGFGTSFEKKRKKKSTKKSIKRKKINKKKKNIKNEKN